MMSHLSTALWLAKQHWSTAEMGVVKQNLHLAWPSVGCDSETLSVYVALTGAFAVNAGSSRLKSS